MIVEGFEIEVKGSGIGVRGLDVTVWVGGQGFRV